MAAESPGQFEIVDRAPDWDPVELDAASGRSKLWWLAVPVLMAGLVGVTLSRSGVEAPLEDAMPPTLPSPVIGREPVVEFDEAQFDDGRTRAEREAELIASFDDVVLLTGEPGWPVRAQSVDGLTFASLPIEGMPILEVDGWLILLSGEDLVAVDLSLADPEPVMLVRVGPEVQWIQGEAQDDAVVVAALVLGGLPHRAQMLGQWSIGEWEELDQSAVNSWVDSDVYGPRLKGLEGVGVFLRDGDGPRRVSDGSLMGANRRNAVVRECEGLDECKVAVYRTSDWTELDSPVANGWSWIGEVRMAPDDLVGVGQQAGVEPQLVDFANGSAVTLMGEFGDGPLTVSVNLVSDTSVILFDGARFRLADRLTGEVFGPHQIVGTNNGASASLFVAVPVDLALVQAGLQADG